MTTLLASALLAAGLLLVTSRPSRTHHRRPDVTARGAAAVWALRAWAGRRRAEASARRGCRELLETVAAELRAGRSAAVALERAGQGGPGLVPAALGALRLGGDVPQALVADGQAPGCTALVRLAACWQVGEGTGAGLAAAVARLAASARDSERVRLELAARVAEPRATMRVLALLPCFGLLLGAGLGADTVGWLLGSAPGRVVLLAGVTLDIAGVLWSRRLVAAVEATL